MTRDDLPLPADRLRVFSAWPDHAAERMIDPAPLDERAVKAWRRAGFAGDRVTPGWDGDPVLILERWPETRAEDLI